MRKILILLFLSVTGAFAQFSTTATAIVHSANLPASCSPLQGKIYFISTGGGLGPYYCSAANTWTPMFASSGSGVTTGVSLTADLPVFGAGGSAIKVGTKTGTGNVGVMSNTPTLITPILGVATATSINKVVITAPATSATLTIADGKTLTVSNTVTFTATDSSTVAFGGGGTVLYNGGALGTPSSGTATNITGLPEAGLTLANNTTNDATTSKHGFLPKLSGNTGECLVGDGTFITCPGGGGGGANTALSNLASVSINTSLLAQTGVDVGSTTKPFRDIYIFGSGTFATTYLKITGTPTGTRTITIPDATGTLLNSGANFTMGAFNVDMSAATSVSLPVIHMVTTTAFTMSSGATGTFVQSATLGGLNINGNTLASYIIHGGNLLMDGSGQFFTDDGTNVNAHPYVAGSGATPATKPTSGHLALWGSNYSVTDGGAPATGTVTSAVIAGTSNQIGAAGTCTITTTGTCTLSLSSTITLPGSLTAGASAMDFGSASSFKIRVAAGATTTTNGFLAYDSTAHMLHGAQSSADAMIPQFTVTPANNDCVKWVVSGSQYKLGTLGSACGGSVANIQTSTDFLRVGPGTSTPTHTLDVYNATASTGATFFAIREGAANADDDAIFAINNNAGSELFTIRREVSSLALNTSKPLLTLGADGNGFLAIGRDSGFTLIPAAYAYCATAGSFANAADTCFHRHAAGVWEVNDSNNGAYTDILLRQIITTPVAVGSLQTCNSGNKGARSFVNDSNAASYTAGIGAVVANGGTTNVPVVCDGTNWRIG